MKIISALTPSPLVICGLLAVSCWLIHTPLHAQGSTDEDLASNGPGERERDLDEDEIEPGEEVIVPGGVEGGASAEPEREVSEEDRKDLKEQVTGFLKGIDSDGDSSLDFEEFAEQPLEELRAALRGIFEQADQDGNGQLSFEEFTMAFPMAGLGVDPETVPQDGESGAAGVAPDYKRPETVRDRVPSVYGPMPASFPEGREPKVPPVYGVAGPRELDTKTPAPYGPDAEGSKDVPKIPDKYGPDPGTEGTGALPDRMNQ